MSVENEDIREILGANLLGLSPLGNPADWILGLSSGQRKVSALVDLAWLG